MQTNNKKLLDKYFREEAPKPVTPPPPPTPVIVAEKPSDNSEVIIKLMNIIATLEMQLIDIKLRDQPIVQKDALATIQRDEDGRMSTISITHKK